MKHLPRPRATHLPRPRGAFGTLGLSLPGVVSLAALEAMRLQRAEHELVLLSHHQGVPEASVEVSRREGQAGMSRVEAVESVLDDLRAGRLRPRA